MRVAGFFLYCFASLLAPVGLGFGLVALRAPQFHIPEQYVAIEAGSYVSLPRLFGDDAAELSNRLGDGYPSSLAAAGAAYEDSTVAFFISHADAGSAKRAAASLVDRIPTSSQVSGPGGIRYVRSDDAATGIVRTVGRHVVWVQGPTRALVEARYSALPAIERNTDTNFANAVVDENLGIFIVVVLIWVALQIFIWPRYASSVGSVTAPPETRREPASSRELLDRLADIESPESPVTVRQTERDNEVLVEWRYDSGRWTSLMASGGVSLIRRLRLRLDGKHNRVLARDEQAAVSWVIGTNGATVAGALTWKAARGIVFVQYERGAMYGLKSEPGSVGFGEHYSFEFSIKELRAPVLAVTCAAGWDYRPVVSFNWLFAG